MNPPAQNLELRIQKPGIRISESKNEESELSIEKSKFTIELLPRVHQVVSSSWAGGIREAIRISIWGLKCPVRAFVHPYKPS